MSNSSSDVLFSAFGNRDLAVVRVAGPGVCRDSVRFEKLLMHLEHGGFTTLVLDLSACPRVDSTFAGVLLRLSTRVKKSAAVGGAPLKVALSGVNATVGELLETLCVRERFVTVDLGALSALPALTVPDQAVSKEDVLRLSLEGHEQLAGLNDENAKKFAALLPLLRAELEKLGGAGASSPSSEPPGTACPPPQF